MVAAAEREEPEAPRLRALGPDSYPDWQAMYLDNVERLHRLMYSRVGNRADAEDLTSEVFQAALPRIRTTASVGEVRAYLLATARTVLADHWRRRFGLEVTAIDVDADLPLLNAPPVESRATLRVERILASLPERYRRILELRFLEAQSVREAAHAMGITVGNAKVLQHRALQHAAAFVEDPQ